MRRTVLLLFLASGLVGCGGGAPGGEGAPSPTGTDLPAEVAQTHDAIVRAARAFDYDALADLLDPSTFTYSFGDRDDPTGYWRQLEESGHVPILGDIMPLVLTGPFGRTGDTYVWPRASATEPARWTEADRESLRAFQSDEDIARFMSFGSYTGWRAGIREDGVWLYFVSGD